MGRITRYENLHLTWSPEAVCHLQAQGFEHGYEFGKVFSILSSIYEKQLVFFILQCCVRGFVVRN